MNSLQTYKQLALKEAEFKALADNAPVWIIKIDKEGIIQYINHITPEFKREEVIGSSVYQYVLPESQDLYKQNIEEALSDGKTKFFTLKSNLINGKHLYYEVHMAPINNDGEIEGLVVISTDITEKKEAEIKLEKSVREREALLKEVHHRAKNNLQIISSILKLHAERTENEETKSILNECKNSIFSMALVHETLYQSNDFSQIDLAGYMERFCGHLRSSLLNTEDITTEKELDPINTSMDRAVTIGLILNEFLTNSMKHAFPDGVGKVSLRLENLKDKAKLTVSDNGVGFIQDEIPEDTLGFDLIEILVEQLEGEIITESVPGKGTKQIIVFPV